MRKTITSMVAFAAVLALATPAVFAADNAAADNTAASGTAASGNTTAGEIAPGQFRVSKLNGAAVYDRQQRKIGTIADVVLNPNGKVVAIAVATNGKLGNGNSGNRTIAVGMNNLKVKAVNGMPQFMLTGSTQKLASAPPVELDHNKNNNGNGAAARHLGGNDILASKLNGADVDNRANKQIGSVKDIVLSPEGRVAEVVVSSNGRNIAVPMQRLHVVRDNDGNLSKVTTNMTQQQLSSAASFNLNPENGSSAPSGGSARNGNGR